MKEWQQYQATLRELLKLKPERQREAILLTNIKTAFGTFLQVSGSAVLILLSVGKL